MVISLTNDDTPMMHHSWTGTLEQDSGLDSWLMVLDLHPHSGGDFEDILKDLIIGLERLAIELELITVQNSAVKT
jgi:hypothetical protein